MTLLETLDQAKHSLFRFEYQQSFSVNSEKELWAIWQNEKRIADEYMQTWWQYITNKKEHGVLMQRVSLIREPLTPYKEMEIEIFKKTIPFGDDIRIISGDNIDKLNIASKDFWLVDEEFVVELNYDAEGKWLGFSTRPSTPHDVSAKTSLLTHAISPEEFMRDI